MYWTLKAYMDDNVVMHIILLNPHSVSTITILLSFLLVFLIRVFFFLKIDPEILLKSL